MTIASEITRLSEAKADIKASIEGKGVSVPSGTKLDGYPALIDQITGGGEVPWAPHPDWPDIENPTSGETWLIFASNGATGLDVPTFDGSNDATSFIDFGDGTTILGSALSESIAIMHSYIAGTGTLVNEGTVDEYEVWLVKTNFGEIRPYLLGYNRFNIGWMYLVCNKNLASNGINIKGNASSWNIQYIKYLVNQTNSFKLNFALCQKLIGYSVVPAQVYISTNTYNFQGCSSLKRLDFDITEPATSVTFQGCIGLTYFRIGTQNCDYCDSTQLNTNNALAITTCLKKWKGSGNSDVIMQNLYLAEEIEITGTVSTLNFGYPSYESAFNVKKITFATGSSYTWSCYKLRNLEELTITSHFSINSICNIDDCSVITVNLPAVKSQSTGTTYSGPRFSDCYNLTSISNTEYLGNKLDNQTTATDFASFITYCSNLSSPIILSCKINRLGIFGSSTAKQKVNSIRLTYAGTNGFTGSSPQIDISHNSLDAAALNLLFGDLPTISGKTIKITGNPGTATCDTTIATAKGWTVTV